MRNQFRVTEQNNITGKFEGGKLFSTLEEAIAFIAEDACFDANGKDKVEVVRDELTTPNEQGVMFFEKQDNSYAIEVLN